MPVFSFAEVMALKTDHLWPRLERAVEINELIAEATELRIPGEYNVNFSEYLRIASEFQSSGVPAFELLGYRMRSVAIEMRETDAVYASGNYAGRTKRKQLELLRRSLAKCAEASEKIENSILKGVV